MHFDTLSTRRLTLRKLTPDVFHFIYRHYDDAALKKFFHLPSDEALQKERDKYSRGISTFNRSFLYFQIIDSTSGEIIGWCGFHTWYTDHDRAEIGYMLTDDNYKAKGIMSEAMAPVIAYGFQQMNLHRIEAFIGPDNVPSLKLAKKFGFREEGRLREHYFKSNVHEDSLVFSLLKAEWEVM
jgi:ribosomal-protein-alanine N-acetyltransferase